MAQSGFTPLLIYSSSTPGNAPASGNLLNNATGSELAINIADGKLFYKDSSGGVQVIAWKVTPATAGGTGQTSYAAGDLLYASDASTLTRLAAGTGVLVGGAIPSYSTNPNIDIQGNAATVTNGVYTTGNQTIGGVKTFNGASGSFGTSTAAGTINVASGATISGATKTVNIGTGGVSGSTTAINIGASTSATTISVDGATTFAIAGTNIFSTVASGAYLRMAASTGGIQFNGDTAAANALDDYEEGTWTVELYDASTGGNVSATTGTGYYVKIGNQVTCSFINLNNINTTGMTAGNQLYFTLPFAVGTNGSGIGSITTEVFAFGAGLTQINPTAEATLSRGRFMTTGTGVANAYLTVATITTGVSDIERLTLTYFTV